MPNQDTEQKLISKAQTEQFQYTGFLLEGIDHKEG